MIGSHKSNVLWLQYVTAPFLNLDFSSSFAFDFPGEAGTVQLEFRYLSQQWPSSITITVFWEILVSIGRKTRQPFAIGRLSPRGWL